MSAANAVQGSTPTAWRALGLEGRSVLASGGPKGSPGCGTTKNRPLWAVFA